MNNLRDAIKAAATAAPVAFDSVALGGLTVHVHRATAEEIRQWWMYYYGYEKPSAPLLDENMAEAARRFCVDAADEKQFATVPAAELKRDKALGGFLAEFYSEAIRVNRLFATPEQEYAERRRFFLARASTAPAPSIPVTTSSANSPSDGATPTSPPSQPT